MSEQTSPSNEGSNNNRDLSKYKKIPTKEVSNNKIKDILVSYDFKINCIACDIKSNVKTADSENPVSVSSADTQVFDLETIMENSPWLNVHPITYVNQEKISKKRKDVREKKRKELENREAEELAAAKKELEEARTKKEETTK